MIPKILHHTWLGNDEPPANMKRSFESWKRFLPDFQFMLWNEDSFDMQSAPRFVREAYANRKYAFASDYIRLWALNRYGGLYLDSDTEVLKPLHSFLDNRFFIGMQVFNVAKSRSVVETKTTLSIGVIASEPGHPYLQDCMDALANSSIVKPDGSIDTTPSNYRMQDILSRYGLKIDDTCQHLSDGIVVYPSSCFSDRL